MLLLSFRLDGDLYGLALAAVERIVRAVEVTPLPGAPSSVLGAFNLQGQLVPVLSLRRRLQRPDREIRPSDQFLIAFAQQRLVAIVIDEPEGVIDCEPSTITAAGSLGVGLQRLQGAAPLDDGLLLIPDLQTFFSLTEERALEQAMETMR